MFLLVCGRLIARIIEGHVDGEDRNILSFDQKEVGHGAESGNKVNRRTPN
jgi:hypothetical protein